MAHRRRRLPWARRPLLVVALAVLLLGAIWDLSRPPESQRSAALLIRGVHLYQASLSPLLARTGTSCRFVPTCSSYAIGALEKRGTLGGTWRAGWRILRCGPWTPPGTHDPPSSRDSR